MPSACSCTSSCRSGACIRRRGAQPRQRPAHADHADNNHWWALNDGHGLDNLLLVQLGARAVHVAHNVGHASFVPHESGEVARLGRIILREGLDLASVAVRALPGAEPQGPVTRAFKLPMRHDALLLWPESGPNDSAA